ncbi:hypothetical protein JCM10296v2_007626 [Rhodotorula toruloides]
MKSPLDTNALPPDLAARFAALRAPSSPPKPTSSPPGPTSSHFENVEQRLKRLETPTKEEVERGVQVAVKGVPVRRLSRRLSGMTEASDDEGDEAVQRFLAEAQAVPSSPPLPSPPSLEPSSPSSPRARAGRTVPALGPSLLDTLSGVEVQFFRPSLGPSTGDVAPSSFGIGREEDDLIRRLRDELKVEEKTNKRDEEGTKEWEKRMEGLRGVAAGPARSAGLTEDALGVPPDLGELEKAVKRKQRKTRRRAADDSSEESDDTSSEASSDSADSVDSEA